MRSNPQVREGIVPTPICTLVFLLLYFSSLAAALWWTLTTASWAVMVLCSLEPKVTYLSYDTERFLIFNRVCRC